MITILNEEEIKEAIKQYMTLPVNTSITSIVIETTRKRGANTESKASVEYSKDVQMYEDAPYDPSIGGDIPQKPALSMVTEEEGNSTSEGFSEDVDDFFGEETPL